MAFTGHGLPPPLEHERQLVVAPDHGRRPARSPSLEAAAGRALAENLEAAHRTSEAFERSRPERAQREHLTQEPARAIRDHHGAGHGRLLQPRREVRRLADHRLLARRALTDEFAHDHEAGRDPDSRRERLSGRSGEPANGRGNRHTRSHGTLGVVLVRAGPAEVGQHAVPHQLRHMPIDARDLAVDRVLVSAQDRAHVLGVEQGREHGRADQVGEQHGQLAALGLRWRRGRPPEELGRRRGLQTGPLRQGGDRGQEPLAVAERGDPELVQLVRGQCRQQVRVDVVVMERRLVLPQAQSA